MEQTKCPFCGETGTPRVSHSEQNPDRPFLKCKHCHRFAWLDGKKGNFAPKPKGNGLSAISHFKSEPDTTEVVDTAPPDFSFFKPTEFNLAIRDTVLNDTHHVAITARAGSGKTTNNAWIASQIPERSLTVKNLVFAKANQLDMQRKMPRWIPTMTSHASGLADLRNAFQGRFRVDERKTLWILKDEFDGNTPHDALIRKNTRELRQLISLCKNSVNPEPTNGDLQNLGDAHDILLNTEDDRVEEQTAELYDVVRFGLQVSTDTANQKIDFDDMIYLPALGSGGRTSTGRPIPISVEPVDLLFVDEFQDNNAAQRITYLLAIRGGGRLVFVGDDCQAIYGFRGAMLNAMADMTAELNALNLSLPISWRCGASIIREAQALVPDILPRPNAPDGLVNHLDAREFERTVGIGDMILCRTNAPLAAPCLRLIRNGVKAVIRGKNIGENLISLVHKVRAHSENITDTVSFVTEGEGYIEHQVALLTAKGRENLAQSLIDQWETVNALLDGCDTLDQLSERIVSIFSDENGEVTFSTIHKAKGLEAEHVWILRPELLAPQKYDKKAWQLTQLRNLRYVAITRARETLTYINTTEV